MANYLAACRSNYFRVKNPKDFEDWCDHIPTLACREVDKENMYMLYVDCPDGSGWPAYLWHEDTGEETELDLVAELSEFLFEGQIAILEEVGYEKLRYLHGSSVAVNHLGETITISLTDMYSRIANQWPNVGPPTECCY